MSIVFYYELPDNNSLSANIPITTNETTLGVINHYMATGEAASLYATIGWLGNSGRPKVLFTIWRDAPFTGTSVCSFVDSCESSFDRYKVSNIAHIDTGFRPNQNVTYVLTAKLLETPSAASVVGGLTFLATVNQLG